MKPSIIVAGGGLAGLAAAIDLKLQGFEVALIEKDQYPRHKLCGEYLSVEVVPYLLRLGVDLNALRPKEIDTFLISLPNNNQLTTKLPLGGLGVSRYALDHHLYERAREIGVVFHFDKVEAVAIHENEMILKTASQVEHAAKFVICALGKRNTLDFSFKRNHVVRQNDWMAVKAHYKGEFNENVVGLFPFKGGYCGVSKVENDAINICFLCKTSVFKHEKNIEALIRNVLSENRSLRLVFEHSKMLFEKPITISQISFAEKRKVENHVIMLGDAAGLIHPLCGNGMAMAINSAEILGSVFRESISNGNFDRHQIERSYSKKWNKAFRWRLWTGRRLAKVFQNDSLTSVLFPIFVRFPYVLKLIIQLTHGKPSR